MTVNPKKLRPYDQPPRRKRALIPGGPDTAATGFLVVAALWFGVATGLGVLALGMRIVSFEFSLPLPVFDLSFDFNLQLVESAFINATVYGWLSNAGFAAIAFMTPRLTGRRLVGETFVNVGLLIWNMSVAGGIAALYIFDSGVHAPLTAFPWFIDGGLATGAFIVTAAFVLTVGMEVRSAYISTWFAAAALLALLGLTTLNALLSFADGFFNLPQVLTALASLYIDRGIVLLWLLGTAFAALHYVVPRASGLPLASGGLAILTWLTWLVLAPLSGLGLLLDSSVPFFVTSLGAVGTMLLMVPASLTVINLVMTISGRWSLLFASGAAAFAAVSLAFLLASSLLDAIGALRSVQAAFSGTAWDTGVFVWGAYGAFGFAAIAMAEHALPRLLRREWGGGFLSDAQLWLAFGGVAIAGVALMGGGMAVGSFLSQGVDPEALDQGVFVYRAAAFAGFGLVALAALAHLVNLFLMYTSGEPAEYTAPGGAVAAGAGH